MYSLGKNCRNGGNCKFEKLADYRKRGLFIDVTFVVEGGELRAHKNVLSARSEVFETMFTTSMIEASLGVVNITDATKEAFEAFIEYLYYDDAEPEVIDEHYAELIYLADKYLVESLTSTCVERLSFTLHGRSLIEMFEIAESFKLLTLQQKSFSYLVINGNDFVNSSDFEKLVADFRLSEMVVSSVMPTTISETINISEEFWNRKGGLRCFKIRNHGHIVELGVRFKHRRKTLYCSLELVGDHISWPVELSFKFSLSRIDGSLLHSGQGDIWWETNLQEFDDWDKVEAERRRELFEYCHRSRMAVANCKFVFNMTLSHWVAPGRLFNKRKESHWVVPGWLSNKQGKAHESGCRESKDRGESQEGMQSKVSKDSKCQSDVDKDSLLSALKEEEDSTCTDNRVDTTTIQTLRQYVSSGLLPEVSEMNSQLIRGAHKFSMRELVEHCEKAIAYKLNSDNVVEFVILARQLDLNKLEGTAMEFINLHHFEVMASKGWPLLKDYPEILATLLKKLLTKPLLKRFQEKLPIPPGISDSDSSESSFRAMTHSVIVESDGE